MKDKDKFSSNRVAPERRVFVSVVLVTALLALLCPSTGMAQTFPSGPALQLPVNLGMAGNFVILSKSGITDVPASAVVGNVGTSPITGAAIGLTCPEVLGRIYTVDAAGPGCRRINPTVLTTAVRDMETAYTAAAGRKSRYAVTELGAGDISGLTLHAGLYKWGTGVKISTHVTLSGNQNAVWIFQIAGGLTVAPGARVILSGGAQAKNVFWQVASGTTIGTTAKFKGNILCKTLIAMATDATLDGRALAQTAVTLQMNDVTRP
jgi:hypothetical protein